MSQMYVNYPVIKIFKNSSELWVWFSKLDDFGTFQCRIPNLKSHLRLLITDIVFKRGVLFYQGRFKPLPLVTRLQAAELSTHSLVIV